MISYFMNSKIDASQKVAFVSVDLEFKKNVNEIAGLC